MQAIGAPLRTLRREAVVQQVSIDIMLQYEPTRVIPVIKDLAAHDVPSDAPAVLITLVPQPIVPQDLGVKIVRLKGRVVDVELWALEKKEGVMVDLLVSAVETEEDGYIFAFVVVDELARHSVSMFRGKSRHVGFRGDEEGGLGFVPRWGRS